MPWILQEGFAGGELSTHGRGVVSSDIAQRACIQLDNAIITRHGSAFKRPGTRFLGGTVDNAQVRMIPFYVPDVGPVVVMLGNQGMVIYEVKTELQFAGSPATPYTIAEIHDVTYAQSSTALFLCHPDHEPRVLEFDGSAFTFRRIATVGISVPQMTVPKRTISFDFLTDFGAGLDNAVKRMVASEPIFQVGDVRKTMFRIGLNGWVLVELLVSPLEAIVRELGFGSTLEEGDDRWQAFEEGEQRSMTLGTPVFIPLNHPATPTDIDTGDIVQITASTFTQDHVGTIVDVDVTRPKTRLVFITEVSAGGDEAVGIALAWDDASSVFSEFLFHEPAQRGTTSIAALDPNGKSGGITITSDIDYFEPAMAPSVDVLLVTQKDEVGGLIFLNGGVARITKFLNATNVEATVLSTLTSEAATKLWSVGWSRWQGYPKAVAFHQDRAWYGGVKRFSNRLFGSRTGKHENFVGGALDDHAMNIGIASEFSEGIKWLRSSDRDLLIGTAESEYVLTGGERAITPTNLLVRRQSTYGSKAVVPLIVGPSLLFINADGTQIREMAFQFEQDRYVSADLTDLADHLFDTTTVRSLTAVTSPETLVFALMEDQTLNVLSFRRDNGVLGWSPWPGIVVHSLIGIQTATGIEQVWMSVQRGSNHNIEILESTAVPMDSQKSSTISPESTTITGLTHLEGLTVQVVHAPTATPTVRIYRDQYVVASGSVTVDGPAIPDDSIATVGLPITFKLQPQDIEIADQRVGSTAGRRRTVNKTLLRVNASFGGTIDGFDIHGWAFDLTSATAPDKVTGWLQIDGLGINGLTAMPTISHSTPHTFEILAINNQVEFGVT